MEKNMNNQKDNNIYNSDKATNKKKLIIAHEVCMALFGTSKSKITHIEPGIEESSYV